ncbi:MAG: hypothetical protein ABFS42_12280 [Candidatus Krumholzibacteriota bacterium]
MDRRPPSPKLFSAVPAPPVMLLPLLLIVFLLAGCSDDDAVVEVIPPAGPAPVLAAEPEFSPGLSNTVSWSLPEGEKAGDLEFLVQRSGDPLFDAEVVESGWIAESSFEFTGLEHASTHHFRVRGRNPQGAKTEWSSSQASTQDAVPPVAALTEMKAEQTSLLFTFELSATDQDSGVEEIELWFGLEGAEAELYGVFPPGQVSFQATGGGIHEFIPLAVDVAGNRQDLAAATVQETIVPEPIIITDRRGEDFDITAAVLEYRMGETFWEFGLGRYTIRPIIDPLMVGPGHHAYPDENAITPILGVKYDDDIRAYKIGDMMNREVVDDVVNGIPIAVCY